MAIETRNREEILKDNILMRGKIEEAEMELYDAYPGHEDELKKIIGTVLDTTKDRDYDDKMLENYDEVYELLGVSDRESAKKDDRASALIVNLLYKRCLNNIEVFKSKVGN